MMMGKQTNFNLPKDSFPFVNAAHWYDAASSITKNAWLRVNLDIMTNRLVLGTRNVQKMFIRQLKFIKDASKIISGGIPTLIGEFGLHCDIKHKAAYKKFKKNPEKAFNKNNKALNMYYNALDANLLNSTQWNYTADNNNEWGDLWNLEDLSIFSRDQQLDPTDINSGGRAIKGFCRPYFVKCAGIPLKMNFNFFKKIFYFEFHGNASIKAPTILYVPKIQYPSDYDVDLSEGEIEKKEDKQLLFVKIKKNGFHYIKIVKR
jgi:hypothetical protein